MRCLKLRPPLWVILFAFPFDLVKTAAFTAHPVLSADVNELMASMQLAELSSQRSLIRLNNHKRKVKQTLFRTCAIFILSTLLTLGNSQRSQETLCLD